MGISRTLQARLKALGRELRDDDIEPYTGQVAAGADRYSATDMETARERIHHSSRLMAQFMENNHYDVILSPTLAKPPVPHGSFAPSKDLDTHVAKIISFMPYTLLANWTGQPAMSVPLYETAAGLPIGVHFFGRFGDEATLFRLASQLEKARPWKNRLPVIGQG